MAIFDTTQQPVQLLFFGLPVPDLLTLLTFLILIVTVAISMAALKESSRSNTLSSLPVLILKNKILNHNYKMFVENIGHGSALNIVVDNYYLAFIDDILFPRRAQQTALISKRIDILKHGEEEALDTSKSRVGGFIDEDTLLSKIFDKQNKLTFYIRYSDVSGVRYISRIIVSEGEVEIASNPKRYNLFWRLFYFSDRVRELLLRGINWFVSNYQQKKANKKHELALKSSVNE